MRTLGILLGSVLGAALLVAIVGVPRLAGPDRPVPVAEPSTGAADPGPAPAAASTPVAPEPAMPSPPAPVAAPVAETLLAAADDDLQPALPASLPAAPPVAPATPAPLRWHAFWSPFRSRVAANGFVSELSRVTGLDYRVVAVRPGVYEVAFGYEDEAEIDAKLAAIRAATGLDMPGS